MVKYLAMKYIIFWGAKDNIIVLIAVLSGQASLLMGSILWPFNANVVMLKQKTFCKAANDRPLPKKRSFAS